VSTCLVVANEIARAMRAGEIGPFIVGWISFESSLIHSCRWSPHSSTLILC
jgi:hypothetical protein